MFQFVVNEINSMFVIVAHSNSSGLLMFCICIKQLAYNNLQVVPHFNVKYFYEQCSVN